MTMLNAVIDMLQSVVIVFLAWREYKRGKLH